MKKIIFLLLASLYFITELSAASNQTCTVYITNMGTITNITNKGTSTKFGLIPGAKNTELTLEVTDSNSYVNKDTVPIPFGKTEEKSVGNAINGHSTYITIKVSAKGHDDWGYYEFAMVSSLDSENNYHCRVDSTPKDNTKLILKRPMEAHYEISVPEDPQ